MKEKKKIYSESTDNFESATLSTEDETNNKEMDRDWVKIANKSRQRWTEENPW